MGRTLRNSQRRGGLLKTEPTGVVRSKPPTPRAGRWREGGLAVSITTGRRPRPRPPFCSGLARGLGPWVRWTPASPRALGLSSRAYRPNDSDAKTRRENDGGAALKIEIGIWSVRRSGVRPECRTRRRTGVGRAAVAGDPAHAAGPVERRGRAMHRRAHPRRSPRTCR